MDGMGRMCAGKIGKEQRVQVSYGEGVANHTGLESCVAHREVRGEALTKVCTGQPLSRESILFRDADAVSWAEGNMRGYVMQVPAQSCAVRDTGIYRSSVNGNREICGSAAVRRSALGRC